MFILPCFRFDIEDTDTFCRRQARQARNVANQCGLWSIVWAKRAIAWKVVRRGANCALPFLCQGFWMTTTPLGSRSSGAVFCSDFSTRNSIFWGRTGTRLNVGRPQVQWSDELSVAVSASSSRSESQRGGNSLSIGARIREAIAALGSLRLCPYQDVAG